MAVGKCERCERRYERVPDGRICVSAPGDVRPCLRVGIRHLDIGDAGGEW